MESSTQDPFGRREHVIGAAVIATALLLGAMVGTTHESFVGGVLAVVIAGALGLAGVMSAIHGQRSVGLMLSAAIFLAVTAGIVATCEQQIATLERRVEPMIAAVEAYRDAEGRYPDSADQLVPAYLNAIPSCGHRDVEYTSLACGREFALTCVTFGFNKHTWDSERRAWYDWD